jgi:hypothetical protein
VYLYRGRSARLSVARMIVWDVLNAGRSSKQSFTCREFYIKHKAELDARISKQVPGLPVEAVVKGALRGLSGRGLMVVQRVQAGGGATYSRNVYSPGRSLVGLSYGEALIEAQRRRTIV